MPIYEVEVERWSRETSTVQVVADNEAILEENLDRMIEELEEWAEWEPDFERNATNHAVVNAKRIPHTDLEGVLDLSFPKNQ
jgi:hypothetical protein